MAAPDTRRPPCSQSSVETWLPRNASTAATQERLRRHLSVDGHGRKAVEQQITGQGSAGGRWGRTRRSGDLGQMAAGFGETTGDEGGEHSVQVGVPREPDVERLELLRRPQQPDRGLPTGVGGPVDLSPQLLNAGALQIVARCCFGLRGQSERGVEGAGVQMAVSGGQSALRASRRCGGQRRRPLHERRRSGQPGTGLDPVGGALELGSHILVRAVGGGGEVPHPAVRIRPGVGRLRERPVCRSAVLR